jgi:hypothetical protein
MTGAGMSLTTMDMVLVVVSNPSFALNITVFAPVWVNVGDQENAPVVVLKVAPVGMVGAESVLLSPSGSVAVTVNCTVESSMIVVSCAPEITGGLLKFTTVVSVLLLWFVDLSYAIKTILFVCDTVRAAFREY